MVWGGGRAGIRGGLGGGEQSRNKGWSGGGAEPE